MYRVLIDDYDHDEDYPWEIRFNFNKVIGQNVLPSDCSDHPASDTCENFAKTHDDDWWISYAKCQFRDNCQQFFCRKTPGCDDDDGVVNCEDQEQLQPWVLQGGGGLPWWAWALIGVGSLVVILLVVGGVAAGGYDFVHCPFPYIHSFTPH